MKRAALFSLLVLAGTAGAAVQEIRWNEAGLHAKVIDVAPGKFAEVCGPLKDGEQVAWSFEADGLLNFNIHFHEGEKVTYPARETGVSKREGLLMIRPVVENLAAASWPKLAKSRVFMTRAVEVDAYERWSDVLKVKANRPETLPISGLSGGNQQKVMLGRWLERESNPLVLAEPTRGVDVGAREDIYATLRSLAAQGKAILVVTSDYEEAIQVADRVLVMARGEIVGEFRNDDVTTANLIAASGG